jgi:hypothetical protein
MAATGPSDFAGGTLPLGATPLPVDESSVHIGDSEAPLAGDSRARKSVAAADALRAADSSKSVPSSSRHHPSASPWAGRLKPSGPSYILPDEVFGGDITLSVLTFTDPDPLGPNELLTQRVTARVQRPSAGGVSASAATAAQHGGGGSEEEPPAAVIEFDDVPQKDLVLRVQVR